MNRQTSSASNSLLSAVVAACLVITASDFSHAGDWPQWRYDAGRSSATADVLPDTLHLQWMRELAAPRPAWPASQPWLRFDTSYTPVAAGKMLLVPSMVTDSVTAYDTDSGALKWRFQADGPVRLAPVAHKGKVYFGSDDGYLYCLKQADGSLVWRFRGGPSDRRVLGNERLISTWPLRGGPVLIDDTIYFTAGIWPFMGIFVHAVDAESGQPVWTNSGAGSQYTTQPHGSPAFAGLAPRGHLAATDDALIIPGGRTQPGCYDRHTGQFRHFQFGDKGRGSYRVAAVGDLYYTSETVAQIADGKKVSAELPAIHDAAASYGLRDGWIWAKSNGGGDNSWSLPVAGLSGRLFLKAGSRFVVGRANVVSVVDVDATKKTAKVVWQGSFQGDPWTMLAADDKLFVVTTAGKVYCYGAKETEPKGYAATSANASANASTIDNPWQKHAEGILDATGASDGYCVMFGLGSGGLAEALVRKSQLHVIVIEPDAKKVDTFRRWMTNVGLYGTRVVAHVGDPAEFDLPPYLALLIVSEDLRIVDGREPMFLKQLFRTLRPYGGTACLAIDAAKLGELTKPLDLANGRIRPAGKEWSLLTREGALPEAADWTHNYADAGNSAISKDARVKTPLGILWFGGPSNDDVLPRHGHGPSPQVAAGRLFIEGPDMLRAIDIYNGRLLWQKELPGLGTFYNNTGHQPGAGEIGSNYISLPDAVYVVHDRKILDLDPANGKVKREYALDAAAGEPNPHFGGIAAWDDLLIATSTPVVVKESAAGGTAPRVSTADLKPLIDTNATWQYLAGSDPQGNWTAVDFEAKDWKTGPAGFGYGDDDDRTVLRDMAKKYLRVYVRKSFEGKDAQDATGMTLSINYDDAFIAYLNGKEIVRQGIRQGSGKDASQAVSHEAEGHETFAIGNFRELLRPGKNVLALEGHNRGIDSTDFTLDPALLIKAAKKPSGNGQASPKRPTMADRFSPVEYSSASRRLVVFDRNSGNELWSRDAAYGFRHNNIAIGNDTLFCIDGLSKAKLAKFQRRGAGADYRPRLLALNVRTGKEIWSTDQNVFGTFLNYSTEHDVLLQAGSPYRDRAGDESKTGMVAYQGKTGDVIWKDLARNYQGPCLIHRDRIIAQGPAYSLLTGEPVLRRHPLTDSPMPWRFTRQYGCNTAIGSEHLLTFRSAAAGFYDMENEGGTGNFGGFKSSCTSNLIIAGGLLNAPEYTRTCACRYQNQTSLALVHDPDVEMWTFNSFDWDGKPVQRVGINFGAPGDRRTGGGTLWLDYPSTGGQSPNLPIALSPGTVDYFRYHSSHIKTPADGNGLAWVAASGVAGVRTVKLTLAKPAAASRKYTVRLHFAEVEETSAGRRVFDVKLQGKTVAEQLDIAKEAGSATALVKTFPGIEVADVLEIELIPTDGTTKPPILSGIEAVAENR